MSLNCQFLGPLGLKIKIKSTILNLKTKLCLCGHCTIQIPGFHFMTLDNIFKNGLYHENTNGAF